MTCAYPTCPAPPVHEITHHVAQVLPVTGASDWLSIFALVGLIFVGLGAAIGAAFILGSALADWMDEHDILR